MLANVLWRGSYDGYSEFIEDLGAEDMFKEIFGFDFNKIYKNGEYINADESNELLEKLENNYSDENIIEMILKKRKDRYYMVTVNRYDQFDIYEFIPPC